MKKKNVDMVEPEETTEEITIKNNNKKGLIVTICAAAILIIGLVFAYTKLLNPKSVFVKTVNKGYDKLEKKLDKYLSNSKEERAILLSGDFKFSMDADENLVDEDSKKMFEEFAKLKLSEKIGIDTKNKEMLMNYRYTYDNEDIFNIGAYVKNEKMFIELKNVYDKYIEYPMNKVSTGDKKSNIEKDDIKYFLSKTKDAIVNNMKSKDFKQSGEKIKTDKKTIKTTKITYGLSEKSATELALNFYKTVYKDSKYIKILAKMSDAKESEIKKNIKESIDSTEEVVKEGKLNKDVKVRFGVLVKGITKKHVGFIFETTDKAKLVYYKNGKNVEFRLSKEDKDVLKSSTKDDKTVITLVANNGQELEINVDKSVKGNITTYEYELSAQGARLSGKVVIDKVKENKDGSGETKISADISMMGLITFKVTGNFKVEFVDKLNLPDTSNSIKYENLTESDLEKINEKMSNSKGLSLFTNMFGSGEQEVVY